MRRSGNRRLVICRDHYRPVTADSQGPQYTSEVKSGPFGKSRGGAGGWRYSQLGRAQGNVAAGAPARSRPRTTVKLYERTGDGAGEHPPLRRLAWWGTIEVPARPARLR